MESAGELGSLIEKAMNIYFNANDNIELCDCSKTMREMVDYFTKEYSSLKLDEYKPLDLIEIEKRISEHTSPKDN